MLADFSIIGYSVELGMQMQSSIFFPSIYRQKRGEMECLSRDVLWYLSGFLDTRDKMQMSMRNTWSVCYERLHHLCFFDNLLLCLGVDPMTDSVEGLRAFYTKEHAIELLEDLGMVLNHLHCREQRHRSMYRCPGRGPSLVCKRRCSPNRMLFNLRCSYVDNYLWVLYVTKTEQHQQPILRYWNATTHRFLHTNYMVRKLRTVYALVD